MKIGVIVATAVVALFILLPSVWTPPEGHWSAKLFPTKRINLGLDLRGGIHVVLGVEVDKALDIEMDKFVADLDSRAKEQSISLREITRTAGVREAVATFESEEDQNKFEAMLKNDYFQVLSVRDRSQRTLRVQMEEEHERQVAQLSLEQAREIVRSRVDEFGVAEPVIQIQGNDRILVQLPGVQDPERAIQLIGKTALLEFKLVDDSVAPEKLNEYVDSVRKDTGFKNNFTRSELEKLNGALQKSLPKGSQLTFQKRVDPVSKEITLEPFLLKSETLITGAALEDAGVGRDQVTQNPEVTLRFTKTGAEAFEKVTGENVDKRLAILLDGVVMSDPYIRERIPAVSAAASISLGRRSQKEMLQEARDLVLVLRSGALPAPVEILENRTVGASLGEDSIQKGTMAMLIGAILVVLFMVFYYRWSGFIADVALILNLLMLFAIMALFQATLTLPGIAGIVLTIGMAVDSNVIIIERIREELKTGKRVRAALEAGYEGAHASLLDANFTTIIAGIILYNFGTGPIRGFAVSLIIGLICNYIAAVWFSRWMYQWYLDRVPVNRLSV